MDGINLKSRKGEEKWVLNNCLARQRIEFWTLKLV